MGGEDGEKERERRSGHDHEIQFRPRTADEFTDLSRNVIIPGIMSEAIKSQQRKMSGN